MRITTATNGSKLIAGFRFFGRRRLSGNSSVGRARPCQGRGREFESRFPLQNLKVPQRTDHPSGNSSVGRARPCQGRGREFESRFPLQNLKVPQRTDHPSGNSSVGRARPCQGRGREFESRFPLQILISTPIHSERLLVVRLFSFLIYSCKQSYPQTAYLSSAFKTLRRVNDIFISR